MNILLISQCSKRALTETRRILDQFGERRGDRTWQTPITLQGLDTLRMLLRKTARKNTAVACHWIRGLDHSELLWIVGDASQFNTQGAVPTNTTSRNILREQDENDWHTAQDIQLLAAMAALFHDFGKASVLFQNKLKGNTRKADPYRHEWVSLRLFQAFVGTDDDDAAWLQRLADGELTHDTQWSSRLQKDGLNEAKPMLGAGAPLANLKPLARAVAWLIVSHHRLPSPSGDNVNERTLQGIWKIIDANSCGSRLAEAEKKSISECWTFKERLPDASLAWRKRAAKLAKRMLERTSLLQCDWLASNSYAMHIARMGLMLADHHYSSCPADAKLGDPSYHTYANTDKAGQLKQRLDEHLIGVEKAAHGIVRALPRLDHTLPRIARHTTFKKRSANASFRWQDKAFDLATSVQAASAQQGFFGINMASTGCGKTLANGRIMYALANAQRGARFTIALGLRTLTLQTGDAFRHRLGLGADQLAVLVGGRAVRELYEHHQAEKAKATLAGSESAADLLPLHTSVSFESALEPGPLSDWLVHANERGKAVHQLLNAPVVVCTVDHLMPACESTRGGHQIVPMLRLLTSDLVLDEPDDFGTEDLYALSRLVHFAGLLGSRVLLSSATLPPALVQGLFAAYLAGRRIYQQNRGIPGLPVNVCCAWFDENQVEQSNYADQVQFAAAHLAFVKKRVHFLQTVQLTDRRRCARIVAVDVPAGEPDQVRTAYAAIVQREAIALHADTQNHTTDPTTGKRLSFGLVRIANIDRLIDVAIAIYGLAVPANTRIHLCVYHSRHPMLVRSAIEQRLDRLLQRGKEDAVFKDPEVRAVLETQPEQDHIFIVLASPVAEVGRDHDYDWAVVEPSSMRSIIQLAGRVRRHRKGSVERPNIVLLNINLRALESPNQVAFVRPGYESADFRLTSHRLTDLLRATELQAIDATPRITQHTPLTPRTSLVDLEHEVLTAVMLSDNSQRAVRVSRWWQTLSHYTAVEQQYQRFRNDPLGREQFTLLPNEDLDDFGFCIITDEGIPTEQEQDRRFTQLAVPTNPGISPWGAGDYLSELALLSESKGMDSTRCAERYGTIDLPKTDNGQTWMYHPALGFRRWLPVRQ